MNARTDYIGVFDSGVGGISVLRQLCRVLPGERFLYFGDSANAPYGCRTPEEIRRLTLAAAECLVGRGLKALVVACNTATAAAIGTLRERYPELIIVGIEPALKPAADRFPHGNIAVMATQATLAQEKYACLLQRYVGKCHVIPLPAPGLVELVEAGEGNSAAAEALLRPLLAPYAGTLDALVLGCTHFPFAAGAIRRILGSETVLIDGGEGTAEQTCRRLEAADLLERGDGCVVLENSLNDEAVIRLCRRLLEGETMR